MGRSPEYDSAMVGIVDDDESVRRAVARLMRSAGYETATYATAAEFFSSPDVATTACLVVDLRMPGITGFGLQQGLAALGRRIPVILITADFSRGTRAHAERLGAVAVLRKPYDGALLLTAVATVMRTH